MKLFKYKDFIKESINKEEYLQKLIDNYGDIERAKEEYEFYSDVLDNYNKNGGEVYRVVFAKDRYSINVKELGNHWTFEKDSISRYYHNIKSDNEGDKPFIITAICYKGSVDYDNSWDNFTKIPDECEINFTKMPKLKGIKKLNIGLPN